MIFFAHGWISKKIIVGFIIMLSETLSQKFHPYSILSKPSMNQCSGILCVRYTYNFQGSIHLEYSLVYNLECT